MGGIFEKLDRLLNLGVDIDDDVNKVRLIRQLNGLNLFYAFIAFSVGVICFLFLLSYPGGLYMGIVQALATIFYAFNLFLASRGKIRFTQNLTINVFEWHLFACAIFTGLWDSPVALVVVLFPLLAALVEVSILRHLIIGIIQVFILMTLHFFFRDFETDINRYLELGFAARDLLRIMGLIYFPVMAAGIIKIIFAENLNARKKQKEMLNELSEAHIKLRDYADQLKDESIRLKAELNVARDIQMMILPNDDELKSFPDQEIACIMRPADEVGGDYYDIIRTRDNLIIGIGDVTGHGLSSGLIMLMAQTAITTVSEMAINNPQEYLPIVNRVLYRNIQRIKEDRNMTLAILSYEGDGQYRIAGQHESFIICREDGSIEVFDTMELGIFVGLMNDIEEYINIHEFQLAKGDVLFLYSDGITEAENRKGEQFGQENICDLLVKFRHLPAETIKTKIIRKLYNYIGSNIVYDDISFIVIKQSKNGVS